MKKEWGPLGSDCCTAHGSKDGRCDFRAMAEACVQYKFSPHHQGMGILALEPAIVVPMHVGPEGNLKKDSGATLELAATESNTLAAATAQIDVSTQGARKKHWRPCKGRRERFRKVIDDLKDKVRNELGEFDVDNISLPDHMADAKTVVRVKCMMERYKHQVLQGVVPDLDVKEFNRILKKTLREPLESISFLSL